MNRLAIVAASAAVSLSASAAPVLSTPALAEAVGPVSTLVGTGGSEATALYSNRTALITSSGAAPRTSFADDFFVLNANTASVEAVEFGFLVTRPTVNDSASLTFDILFTIYDTINYTAAGATPQFSDGTQFLLTGVTVNNLAVGAAAGSALTTGLITLATPVSLTRSADSGLDVDGAFSVAFLQPGRTTVSAANVVPANRVTPLFADTAVAGPTVGDSIDGFWRDGSSAALDGIYSANEARVFTGATQSNLFLGIEGSFVAIPEPTSLGLVGLGALAAFRRRRA